LQSGASASAVRRGHQQKYAKSDEEQAMNPTGDLYRHRHPGKIFERHSHSEKKQKRNGLDPSRRTQPPYCRRSALINVGAAQFSQGKSVSLVSTKLTRLLQCPCTAGFPGGTSSSVPAGTIARCAVARRMRDRTIAVAANLPGETFCFRQIVTPYQILALGPVKLRDGNGDIGRPHAAGRLAATRAIAVAKAHERRGHFIAHRFAQTTSFKVCSAIDFASVRE
jgi:hypothetical protein